MQGSGTALAPVSASEVTVLMGAESCYQPAFWAQDTSVSCTESVHRSGVVPLGHLHVTG